MKNYQLTYIDGTGGKTSILIRAKSESHCRQIFKRKYGFYSIIEIKEIK